MHAQLAQHVLHMGADRVRGEEQALGDRLAAQARDHAAQHLALARGQGLHQPLALGAVLARGRQLPQDAGEQGGRQMGLVAQHPPDDGEQPGQRAVLGDPARRHRPAGRARPGAGRPSRRARRSVRRAGRNGRPATSEIPSTRPSALPSWTGTAGRTPGTLPPRSASTSSTSYRRPSAAARSRQRSAAGPLPAAETSTSGSAASAAASDSAKMRWSSTTRTRMRTTETPFPKLLERAGDTPTSGRRRRSRVRRPEAVASAARPPPCRTATPTSGVVPDCLAP